MRRAHPRPWRRGSDYARPPCNRMDRDQRHVWRRRVVAEARAGNLPGKAILTAEAFLACMGADGQLYPSQAAIAAKAGVGKRTVARHVAQMEALGLLRRHRRLVRMPWPEAGRGAVRVQQDSNAYELLFPAGHVQPGRQRPRVAPIMRPVCGCHSGPEESDRRFNHTPMIDRIEARNALEAIGVARQAVLAANWAARRAGVGGGR